MLAKSPTGSGKTIAFGAPIADRIEAATAARPRSSSPPPASWPPRSSTTCARSPTPARCIAAVYGGVGIVKQAREAARAHIVVATPGRLEDLLQRGDLNSTA